MAMIRVLTDKGCREATPEEEKFLGSIYDEIKRRNELLCHAVSDVPMPKTAQKIHGRECYDCVLAKNHDLPHRYPADGRIAEWYD